MRLAHEKRPGPFVWIATARADFLYLLLHPKRWILPSASAVLLCLLLYLRIVDERVPWQVGQRASRTVTAHTDTWFEDTEATTRRREDARKAVSPVYDERSAAAAREARQVITATFVQANIARRDETSTLDRLNRLRDSLPIPLTPETLSTLVTVSEADLPVVEDMSSRLVDGQMSRPLPDRGDALEKARAAITDEATNFQEKSALLRAAVEIAQKAVRPNQLYNARKTMEAQEAADRRVEPVRILIRRNEVVIAADDRIEQAHIDMLRALGKATQGRGAFLARVLAAVATVIGLLLVLGYYLRRYRSRYADSPRCTGIIVGSLVMAALAARLIAVSRFSEPAELATVSALAIVIAALLDTEVALVASVFMAFFADLAAPGSDPRFLVAGIVAGTIAAFTTGAGGSRTAVIIRTALVCGLANGILLGAVSTVFGLSVQRDQMTFAAIGGVVASFFAAGAIMVLERPLRITTELRLLELSNPQEPVLKQLTVEAPATYASSVSVGNLAEAAAEAVGADALLTRVGSYYHDIGKLKRPYYFIENQQSGPNPHDRLTPHLSARVIIAHVRDGLEIADQIGLPKEIRAFVAEHHGTTLVEYFYEKALQSADDRDQIIESAFRYDGPKPQTRESAVVMIADTVEAVSRTLSNPDLDALRTLVRNLVQYKIDDGQFDECNLTFADIHTIEDSLVRSLAATFHQRVKYPARLEEQERAREAART